MKNRIIITGGTIVDGSGSPGFTADILVENGFISSIGKIPEDVPGERIDASGKTVTPGFFDSHRHCDYALTKEGFGEIELRQGITSAVTGSCGLTPFPRPVCAAYKEQLDNMMEPCLGRCGNESLYTGYKTFADYIKTTEQPLNIGNLIGSCSVRIAVKGFDPSPFTKLEMETARSCIRSAMEEGALGMSMGLMYYPEYYSTREELTELAKAAASCDRILTCHIRGEGDSLIPSLQEIIHVAERAEIPLQISHLKSCGKNNWGRDIYRAMDLIEEKRAGGMDIMADFYPYHGGSTTLLSLIPPSFMKDTLEQTWDYMGRTEGVQALEEKLAYTYETWDNYILSLGYDNILISSCRLPHNQCYIGKTITEAAHSSGTDPTAFICRIMAEEEGKVGIIVMSMSQSDVDEIAKLPYTFLISDALYIEAGSPHPRLYGAFPRMIRDFVVERGVLSLEEAVSKMTFMPAKRMHASKRGLIRAGYYADLNIFDPGKLKDQADFDSPAELAEGMDLVMVNGEIALQGDALTERKAGRFIGRL